MSLSFFRREIESWSKSDGSLATEADIAIERMLRMQLAVERPGDAVLGEEEGQTGTGPRRWIIDAIDGTVHFAAASSDWGILIALECDDRIVVGVCDQPVHQRRDWAATGRGAFRTDASGTERRLHVSDCSTLSSARSYVSPPERLTDDRARRVARAVAGATRPLPHRDDDHPALQVAAGEFEVAVVLLGGPWDLAALVVIVEEAGGRFSDASGRVDVFQGTGIYSNNAVHDAVLQLTAPA